jgi:hypothetical protein
MSAADRAVVLRAASRLLEAAACALEGGVKGKWMAVGLLGVAEDELLAVDQAMSLAVRDVRLAFMPSGSPLEEACSALTALAFKLTPG